MGKKNILKNYSYYMVYQIISIILPILTTPYLSRVLGVESLGIYGYTLSVVTYFVMFSALGISRYGEREIAYVQDNRKAKSKIFWELNTIRCITTIVSTIIFIVCFCQSGEYSTYYKILIFELISVVLDIAWLFQGEENFKKIAIRNSLVKVFGVILIFVFVNKPSDLKIYFWIYVISNFLSNGTLWLNLKQHVDFVKIDFRNLKCHIRPMVMLLLPQIAISIYTVLDKTMLGVMLTDISEVGYYEQAQKIIKIALAFATNLSTIMVPRISSIYAQGDMVLLNEYMKKSFRFNWLLSLPIVFGIIAISSGFVPWFFGEGYDSVIKILICYSPIVILTSLSTTIGEQYLISVRKQNIYTKCVLVCAIVNVLLNYLLISKFKCTGAVISTILAESILVFLEMAYMLRHENITLKTMFNGLFFYGCISIIMGALIFTLSMLLTSGILATTLEIILGIVFYFSILILFKDKLVMQTLKKVFKR